MTALTINDYQRAAQRTDQQREVDDGLAFPLLGLFGETGSLLSEVKKKQRDPIAYLGYEENVLEELGDVLWYLAAVADRAHLTLSDLACNLDRTLSDWQPQGVDELTFLSFEGTMESVLDGPSPKFENALLRLSAEVGLLMTDYSAGRLQQNRSALKGRLVGVLRALRVAAHEAGVPLYRAASANIAKIEDRWPVDPVMPPLFDEEFPATEQLPRKLCIEIAEIERDGRSLAVLTRNGMPFGDPLSDNRADDDDYRFHDVFHLSYAAHLGWSPTLRRLLRVKRKSSPRIDEVEDGARAVLIEEGIATWIFNHAQQLAMFEGIEALDYGLLKSVRRFVAGYEAARCPLWLWEKAILRGYDVFRAVQEHRGGKIEVNLEDRSIGFIAP